MPLILPQSVADYLSGHNVMTLATQGTEGPWAAAVFYANDGCSLIFLSSPNTRHCRNLMQDTRCAATIQEDYSNWSQIKGIQLEGRVTELLGDEERRAQQIYGEKFPIASPLGKMPSAIVKALAKVTWFQLVPEYFYFIDNSKGFGHRERIAREQS